MPLLYVVATPIGNLEDVTLRALRVLREVDLIAAEDTRVTRRLLARHEIKTPTTSYHEHNKASKLPSLVAALKDKDVALVSDAGMPGINDPGAELVWAAADAGYEVVSIPGASAVTSALGVSGLEVDKFIYLGFLPRKQAERKSLLASLASDQRALLAFETPHRLRAALADVRDTLGGRRMAVCRELTKLHEEVFRGTASEALDYFSKPRGEFTLVIEGGDEPQLTPGSEEAARRLLRRMQSDGAHAREAVSQVAEQTGLSRRQAYRLWLEEKRSATD